MGYFLAIDVGAERTVAAVARAGTDHATDDVATVDLGGAEGDDPGVASVLHLGEDGVLTVGAAAQEWAATQPDRVVAGFPGRIGDGGGDPMLLAGEPWAPEELTAWLVRWVVDRVAEQEGTPAAAVAVIHPGAADAARTYLLADAVAEQDLDATFVTAPGEGVTSAGRTATDDGTDDRAVRTVAAALRAAATVGPDTGAAAHAAPATIVPADVVDGGRSIPAPRSTDSGGHRSSGSPDRSTPDEPAPDGRRGEPPTLLEAGFAAGADGCGEPSPDDLDSGFSGGPNGRDDLPPVDLDSGFSGGMGATNTAGLLSGYTPPQGLPRTPASGGQVAVATPETVAGRPVALPAQRTDSGRWDTVAPAEEEIPQRTASARPVRNSPVALVAAGGLAAAVAVVATLLLWPAPRITNSAVSRPAPAVAVATPEVLPTASLAPTPAPTTTSRPRPAPPRTRRPAPPPPPETAPPSVPTTAAPTTTEPPDPPTTSAPPTSDKPDPDED